ncbi:hypothetical protein D9Q98_000755 [Chlorella vulgaris]|uniref:Uncharacterized protein n=1 Tax=Chlorella vulgaris TaxID=3077 RepID=A0A9D4TYN1_CHLVU|nr:hypothetical protein D9Q98_000755 [Chlorella vulgaris]
MSLCRALAAANDGQEELQGSRSEAAIRGEVQLPSQGQAAVAGVGDPDYINRQLMEILAPKTDYLAEFLAIQNQQPRNLGFFGTRNMGFMHQQLIEVLSYAMLLTGNHIFTSGATGTNAAVIRGALRAEKPELLTVVLPQSMSKQPAESQELLQQVQQLIEMPQNDELQLQEASRICNQDIVQRVQQVICFAFHDSNLLLETCQNARTESKPVCLFFLD